ncbi:hypothetical protein [Pollutimonas bauzanensis]|uniref:Uncharacterized protein n=1 Tax=Pollutimonas bauzanensis TaxID=658167 RepID=A0A1M5ZWK6_9BURK|nr:hypothetical protein [Pollutimonas bauzanensis]SHI28677.1 hypothetical protein SAMN04488135_1202 [Pollutimonas bauzanensis]
MKLSTQHHLLLAFTLVSLCQAASAGTAGITGKYIGQYNFQVNAPLVVPSEKLPAGYPSNAPYFYFFTTEDGTTINRPAYGFHPSFWEWDFDAKVVRFAPTRAFAMELITVQPVPRSFGYQKVTRQTRPLAPEQTGNEDISATLQDNGDGTYTVKHSLQFYLDMAGYPLAYLESLFRVTQNPATKQLSIEPLPATSSAEHPALVELNKGIPGSLTAQTLPFLVAPAFYAPVMYPDLPIDCNQDGITDAEARLLGLNPCMDDQGRAAEKIGPYPFFPKDTNNNGIYDVWEEQEGAVAEGTEIIKRHPISGHADNYQARLNGMKLRNGEFINLVNKKGDYFIAHHSEGDFPARSGSGRTLDGAGLGGAAALPIPADFLEILPTVHPESGKPLDWSMGQVFLRTSLFNNAQTRFFRYADVRNTVLFDGGTTSSNGVTKLTTSIDARQATLDALDPAAPNYESSKNNLEVLIANGIKDRDRALILREWATAELPAVAAAYEEEGQRLFGANFANYTATWINNYASRLQQSAKTIQSDGLDNGLPAFANYTIITLEFPQGVPEGLVVRRLFLNTTAETVMSGKNNRLPHQESVQYRVMSGNKSVEVLIYLPSATGDVTTPVKYSDKYVTQFEKDGELIVQGASQPILLGIAHTESSRVVDYSDIGGTPTESTDPPNPVTPPVQTGSGGGGGALGGELAGLLGLALLPLRRRIGARLNRWATRLGA